MSEASDYLTLLYAMRKTLAADPNASLKAYGLEYQRWKLADVDAAIARAERKVDRAARGRFSLSDRRGDT